MTHWILRPLHLGNIRRDKSVFTYMKNMGTQIDFPVIAWYTHQVHKKSDLEFDNN